MGTMRPPLVDAAVLMDNLRLATSYAAAAGLLKDKAVLQTLKTAEDAMAADSVPNIEALSLALSDVCAAIAPLTLVDLAAGRNPLSTDNQHRARWYQLILSLLAFGILIHIGYFMHSLQREQSVLAGIASIQEQRPREKLVALRKLAQYEAPLDERSARNDLYHERIGELITLNDRMAATYTAAVVAEGIPLFPLSSLARSVEGFVDRFAADEASDRPPAGPAMPPADLTPPAPGDPAAAAAPPASAQATPPAAEAVTMADLTAEPALCQRRGDGGFELPREAAGYPNWVQLVLVDALSDFCFQLNAFGDGSDITNQSLQSLSVLPAIREKVALRVDWFLPFFFGLLGATLYVMRNVGSIRLPAVALPSTLMRISLGGVAGIAIGWFSINPADGGLVPGGNVSLPFILAFVVGYGIDALFQILDRFNRLIADTAGPAKPA